MPFLRMTLLGEGREAMRDAHKTLHQLSCRGNNSRELFEIELRTYLFFINPLFRALFDSDFFLSLSFIFFLAIKYHIYSNFFSIIITAYFKTTTAKATACGSFFISPEHAGKLHVSRLSLFKTVKKKNKGGQICKSPGPSAKSGSQK